MMRLFQRTVLALALAGAANSASAFSLLGPFAVDLSGAVWQTPTLFYNPLGGDIGGPMNLGEEYRWNVKTITYGFDESFLNYFGAKGTAAVMEAVAILNNLPPMSQMSSDLSEFPLETKRMNYQANTLLLFDLKSFALATLVEEMGLASPERYVWTLRSRFVYSPSPTNYAVIMRNFDPVTWAPSKYVNGTLYTYYIQEFGPPYPSPSADAIESQVDPLAFTYTAVVSAADGFWGGGLNYGEFFMGLTRDDVGGLRYLYRPNNYNIETLIPGTTGGSGGPWTPIYPTNAVTTNLLVDPVLRPGVDKIVFQPMGHDSVVGNFLTITQQYTDTYVFNSTQREQNTQRVLTTPDILFAAGDLGLVNESPVTWGRTASWVNNDALNGLVTLAGPGEIQPQIQITFSTIGPYLINSWPYYLDEANWYSLGFVWASFDGSTNPPVIYPNSDLYPHTSIQDLEQWVLGGD